MDGMGGIVTTVSDLKELLEIRTVLDTLMQKDNLDSADSLLMESAIDRMQILEKRLAEANKHTNSP
jgi:predicted component of type VI protein secretion system